MNARYPTLLKKVKTPLLVALAGSLAASAMGQWATQTINLQPGWNSVYLEVQPDPADCDTVLAGVPVESAWAWNRRFTTAQYIQDPNSLLPGTPDWLTYLPPANSNRAVQSLFTFQGDHAYLIKLTVGSAPVTWTIRGRPSVRNTPWLPDSYNLVGFHVDPASPPTFQGFFGASPAHAGQLTTVRRLNASGIWAAINPATDTLGSGEAFWIYCVGQSTYTGPLGVLFEQGHSLDYGRSVMEQTLTLQNNNTNQRTLSITQLPSLAPADGSAPLAGPVPLSFWKTVLPTNFGFIPLPAQTLLSNSVPAGGAWAIRLAVRRLDMAVAPASVGPSEPLYQSVLQVSDGAGSRWLVPVTARGMQTAASAAASARSAHNPPGTGFAPLGLGAASPPDPRAGLWVGSVVINRVNEPASDVDPLSPTPTAQGFPLRLLLHVDQAGQTRLLQQVLMMWKDGTYTNDPTSGALVMDQPGRYVLLTDERRATNYSGAALRGGQPVARRFSSATLASKVPILLSGTGGFGDPGTLLVCTNVLSYTNIINPFLHPFHPDHDNWDDYHTKLLAEGEECPTITRVIQFHFTAQDPEGLPLAGWGDSQLAGTYSETISGLHQANINVAGIFRLQQACHVVLLNDGL